MLVLVVDDDKKILCSINLALKSQGHEALSAEDELGALAVLDSRDPSQPEVSVILSDLLMPNCSDDELLVEIRKRPNHANLPFAIMSGNANADQVRHLWNLGVDGVICKPFTMAALIKVLEETIQRRQERNVNEMLSGSKTG